MRDLFRRCAGAALIALCGCVGAIEGEGLDRAEDLDEVQAAATGATLIPAVDIGSSSVAGVGDPTHLYANVDDGASLSRSDDDASYVRTVPGAASGAHRVGYPSAPARPIATVAVRFRARLLGGSSGSAQATVFDGSTAIAQGKVRSLTTAWTSFDESFPVALSSAARLRTRILMKSPTGEGVAYTQVLLRVTFAIDDTTPPTVPTDLHAVSTTDTTISIAWDASTDDAGVDSYTVYKDGNPHMTIAAAPAPAFTDTGIWPHSTHSYYVTATDTSGNTSGQSAIISPYTLNDTTPPTAPTNLQGTFDRSAPSITLIWGASTDNVQLDHYEVYRGTGNGPTLIGTAAAPGYVDRTVVLDATSEYFVIAVDSFYKQSAESNRIRIVTDTQAPTTPGDLRVTATTSSSISLAWSASTDNFSVARYHIHRDGALIATQSAASGTTFYDGPRASATSYSYTVIAEDPSGNLSSPSNIATGTTR